MDDFFNDIKQEVQQKQIEEQAIRKREQENMLREAVTKYQEAAMDGDPKAQYALAYAYFQSGDHVTSLSWWKQSAKKGLTCAWTRVAIQYAYGLGVEKDPATALDCLWNAVKGDPDDSNALCHLGLFYEQGIGTEKNMEQAITCYRQAAEQGEAMAQFTLGVCYFFGNGLKQDNQLALEWINKAADQNWAEAQYFLGLQHFLGEKVDRDLYLSLNYLRKAAENGSEDARQLAEVVENEISVERNMSEVNSFSGMLDQFESYMRSMGTEDDDNEDEDFF